MTESDYKEHLIEYLALANGRKCAKCGTSENLTVDFTVGQEYLELDHFRSEYANPREDIWRYYVTFFPYESEYLGLVCTKCKQYHKPDYPTLKDIKETLGKFLDNEHRGEIEKFLKKYPQAKPIHMRIVSKKYFGSVLDQRITIPIELDSNLVEFIQVLKNPDLTIDEFIEISLIHALDNECNIPNLFWDPLEHD